MMDNELMKSALEIVKAQASVRSMTAEEITSMVKNLCAGLDDIARSTGETDTEPGTSPANIAGIEPGKAVRERSIICLECGQAHKILTAKHLSKHGLTPDEYREKHGYKKGLPLVCKSLQRERRKKMQDIKLWERRAADKAEAVTQ